MEIRPDVANVMRGGELLTVSPEEVKTGEEIVVKPGEKVPLDGTIIEGTSALNTVALTGAVIDADPPHFPFQAIGEVERLGEGGIFPERLGAEG